MQVTLNGNVISNTVIFEYKSEPTSASNPTNDAYYKRLEIDDLLLTTNLEDDSSQQQHPEQERESGVAGIESQTAAEANEQQRPEIMTASSKLPQLQPEESGPVDTPVNRESELIRVAFTAPPSVHFRI